MNIKIPNNSIIDTISKTELNTIQRKAFDAALSGKNLFITGVGGVGKSFVIKHH
jgi:MoxR-like ATPase